MSQIIFSSQRSEDLQPGAYNVINAINKNTSPEQFDALVRSTPQYQLEYGGRCGTNALAASAKVGNVALIRHIVAIGNRNLLNLGDSMGSTPLVYAIEGEDPELAFQATKELIRLGANVNISCHKNYPVAILNVAVSIQNLKLVKLLLLNGAVMSPNSDAQEKEYVHTAREQIKQEKTARSLYTSAYFHPQNTASKINPIPFDAADNIFNYLRPDPEFSLKEQKGQ